MCSTAVCCVAALNIQVLENALLTLGSLTPRIAKDLSLLNHVAVSCFVRLVWALVNGSTSATGREALFSIHQMCSGGIGEPKTASKSPPLAFPEESQLHSLSPAHQEVRTNRRCQLWECAVNTALMLSRALA